jgi:pimeloyl-ACP methyl ester carboxylesterase
MPLIVLARLVLSALSLAILVAGGYLAWSWYDGAWLLDEAGRAYQVREDWRLWTAIGLLAWSFLGRLVLLPLLARPDKDPTQPRRVVGTTLESPTGSKLHVEMEGPEDAAPIILTHGWGLDATIWFYLRRELSQRYRVIAWDLPGLGKSTGFVSLTDFAADLESLLALTGGRKPILIGHSIGGMTIQTLVREHPDISSKIAGVVLLNTTYTDPLETMILSPLAKALRWPLLEPAMRLAIWLQPLAWISAWQSYLSGSAHLANRIGFSSQVTRSQLEHTTLLATRNPPGAQAKGNLAMFRWDATGALQALSVPALIIAGDRDLVTKCEASQSLADAAPESQLVVVPKANHMGFLEQAGDYNRHIAEFCGRVLAEASARPVRAPNLMN